MTSSVGSSGESGGNVDVRPQHLLARGGTRRVEHGRLHREHVGPAGDCAASDGVLARLDLGAGAAEMHGRRSRDVGVLPTESDRRVRSRPSPLRRRSGSGGSRARTPAGMSGWVSSSRGEVSSSSRSPAAGSPQSSSSSEVTRMIGDDLAAVRPQVGDSASAMRCAPPRGYAHPSPACACAARKRPEAAAPSDGRGVLACANTPVSSAFASSVANVRRPRTVPS